MTSDRYDDESECDWDDDDSDGYIPCPKCGETMLESADYCPACKEWITSEDITKRKHSWWVIAVILLVVGMMILAILPG